MILADKIREGVSFAYDMRYSKVDLPVPPHGIALATRRSMEILLNEWSRLLTVYAQVRNSSDLCTGSHLSAAHLYDFPVQTYALPQMRGTPTVCVPVLRDSVHLPYWAHVKLVDEVYWLRESVPDLVRSHERRGD